MNTWTRASLTMAILLVASPAHADDQTKNPPPPTATPKSDANATEPPDHDHDVQVRGDHAGDEAASRTNVKRIELELRPRLRPGDVLEAVPGLFAVQHAGGGKANQYFLRGFDADHGTDVAFFVDGVPINMVSHAHGQGFTDFHFLIPELVVSLDGYKGPYYAQFGDFATAGAVNLHLAEKYEESYAQYSIGQYGIMRGLVVASPNLGDDWRTVVAAELYKNDGPFQNPEDLKRFNVYLRATHDIGRSGKVSMTWMSYGSTWNGSGQIPARAVCGEGEPGNPPPETYGQPCIDRFGTVDRTEGGGTQRHMASIAYTATTSDSDLTAMAYMTKYKFSLFSNFTFFADDPVRGDQIEQVDDRIVFGGDFRVRHHTHYAGAKFVSTFGAQIRSDSIDNALFHDQARVRLEERVGARIGESQIGVYAEEDVRLTKWLRFIGGIRGDRLDVSVDDKLASGVGSGNHTSGVKGQALLSPKFMAVVTPFPELDLFADYGRGFHSNDARGVVQGTNAATLMTPAIGYELGARVRPIKDLTLTGAWFLIDLQSELVWSGDAGTTEPSGRTRRYGVELGARYHISNWLFADIDATFTRARFRENEGNGQAVALAPTRTLTAGIGVRRPVGNFIPFGSVRVKHIGDRPAIEDESLTAQGFTTVDANLGLRWKDVETALDVQNLFDVKWREVNFATTTRLAYEPAPVTGIHYAPGWPRTVMARATLYWR